VARLTRGRRVLATPGAAIVSAITLQRRHVTHVARGVSRMRTLADRIRKARQGVVETEDQKRVMHRFAERRTNPRRETLIIRWLIRGEERLTRAETASVVRTR
jgi:hypothetical protein